VWVLVQWQQGKETSMKQSDWSRFCTEGLTSKGEFNVTHDFVKMTKMFGRSYLDYLFASYAAKDTLTDSEWAALNGNVPQSFIDSKIKSEAKKLN